MSPFLKQITKKPYSIYLLLILLSAACFFSFGAVAKGEREATAIHIVPQRTVVLDGQRPFAEQITQENTIYEIRHSFDLQQKDVVIPDNSVLRFIGGSLRNFSLITFNRTYIDAPPYQIFYFEDMKDKGDIKKCNGEFTSSLLAGPNGGLLNDRMPIEWFGAIADSDVCSAEAKVDAYGTDCSSALQFAINTSHTHRNTVYLTPQRHHYHVANTIYLPSSFSITGENYAYELNSFGDNNSYASELFFSCKYLFRAKKNKGQSEQERLNNNIKANIDGIAIHGILTAAPRPLSAQKASLDDDVYSHNGDYYWEKKTYVFFGCILDGSKLTNLKVWGVGTFIYGAVRGLTQMSNNTIRYSRNLICGAAGNKGLNGKWSTKHDFPLADGSREIEFGSNSSYTINGIKYVGYEEPIECYISPSGSIASYDVTIENNYFTCPPTRCITFYEIAPEQVTIANNYIDFAFAVFAFQSQSEIRIFHNTFDYCYMVLTSRAFDKISFVSNAVTRCNRESICEGTKYNIAWWDDDYKTNKKYATSGVTDGKGFASTSHNPVAIVLTGDINTGYIRNTKINDNTFAGVQKFFMNQKGELRKSSNLTISGNTFDPDCDNSFNVRFTNGDGKNDDGNYDEEAKNIYVQQWDNILIKDRRSFPKVSQNPSHSSGTWLAQNINTIFIDAENNNYYRLVDDQYVPLHPIKSTSPLNTNVSFLKGNLPLGSSGIVYDEQSKRFGMIIKAGADNNGSAAVDGDGFKVMKKRDTGWVKTSEEGYQQYNTSLHRWGYYLDGSFVDFQGFHFAVRSGASFNRPTNVLTASDEGYEYYDTDLRAPVYFTIIKGVKKWTTANGVDVSNVSALKGTSSQRKSMWLNSDNEGLQFYDTTLKRWVLFNGKEWTNLDGSQL